MRDERSELEIEERTVPASKHHSHGGDEKEETSQSLPDSEAMQDGLSVGHEPYGECADEKLEKIEATHEFRLK